MTLTIGKVPVQLSLKDALLLGVFALLMLVVGGPLLVIGALVGGLILALSNGQRLVEERLHAGEPVVVQPPARVLHSKHWDHPAV